jgi:hypothetical protein
MLLPVPTGNQAQPAVVEAPVEVAPAVESVAEALQPVAPPAAAYPQYSQQVRRRDITACMRRSAAGRCARPRLCPAWPCTPAAPCLGHCCCRRCLPANWATAGPAAARVLCGSPPRAAHVPGAARVPAAGGAVQPHPLVGVDGRRHPGGQGGKPGACVSSCVGRSEAAWRWDCGAAGVLLHHAGGRPSTR